MAKFEDRIQARIFASIDVVGSTEFKQRAGKSSRGTAWVRIFQSFYGDFLGKVQEYCHKAGGTGTSVSIRTWKLLGDELLLVAEVESYADVRRVVDGVILAVGDQNGTSANDKPKLKATCWLGHFPFVDRDIDVSGHLHIEPGKIFDYIGPSIDCGFRLKEFATPARCVLSVDLAFCLLCDDPEMALFFDGKRPLKGVLDGSPYPILWLPVGYVEAFVKPLARTEALDQLKLYIHQHPGTYLLEPDYLVDAMKLPQWARLETLVVVEEEQPEPDVKVDDATSRAEFDKAVMALLDQLRKEDK